MNQPGRRTALVAALVVLSFGAFLMLPVASAHGEIGSSMFMDAEPILAAYVPVPSVVVDGNLGSTEYNGLGDWRDTSEGVEVVVERNDTSLYAGIINGAGAWVAVGFGPSLGEGAITGPFDVIAAWTNGTTGQVEDRSIPVLTDEFETIPRSGTPDVLAFGASSGGMGTVFELQISFEAVGARAVSLESGSIFPFFVAFGNVTGPPPVNLSEGDVHTFRMYPLRPSDIPSQIEEIFMGPVPPGPAPTVVAVSVVSLGLIGLGWRFAKRPRGGGA